MANEADTTEKTRLRLALSARPEATDLCVALAGILCGEQQREEALAVLREGLLFAGNRSDGLMVLADGMADIDAVPDAIAVLQSIVRQERDNGIAYARLADLWGKLGERQKADAAAAQAGRYGVAVASSETVDGPTPALARHMFDQYASRFEDHLVNHLQYRVPQEIEHALMPLEPVFHGGTIVDIGCGTGLMAQYLRLHASVLIGIDLSPAMLAEAADKQLYDHLVQEEAANYLAACNMPVNLIVAADVLVYIGDLTALFTAAAKALRPDGLFVATVETHNGNGFELTPARRYAHAKSYIEYTAALAGLSLILCKDITPRLDSGLPVEGLLFILRHA